MSQINRVDDWKILKPNALKIVKKIINEISQDKDTKFDYNRITIRNQKTKWGSCSSKKNINFNYKIVYLPHELSRYLVIHELCHLKYLNHSRDFWNYLSTFEPNYRNLQKRLRNYDSKL